MIRKTIDDIVLYQFERLEGTGVTHAFLTRLGGVSGPPFDTLNLGHTVGDDPEAVEENHRRVFTALRLRRQQATSPHQVHGAHVQFVGQAHAGTIQPATDGLLTATPDVALLLRFADCVPLLLFDPVHRAVAMVHSGWKSSAGNIVAAAVEAFVRHVGSRPGDLWAGIGPAIDPCCYQVESDMAKTVARACPKDAEVIQQRDGARQNVGLYLDLPGAVRAQLTAAGVGQVEMSNLCTACHTGEWFSHRTEQGQTGRFGALVMLER